MLKSERLNQWLRDAHAMELQAEQLLRGQVRRSDSFPALSARVEEHITTTRAQRGRLEACISRRKTAPSMTKDLAAKVAASLQNFGGIVVEDSVVKGLLAIYTFEQMSAASYGILEAGAIADSDHETAHQCALARAEEEAFCGWLKDHLGEVTINYLQDPEMV
jgi:ferritin-like metal-binding protein YciE